MDTPQLETAVLAQLLRLDNDGAWTVRTHVTMPDHLHLLIVLGSEFTLSAVVRSFKGRLAPALRSRGLCWERGYFDHRVRADEDRWPIFQYVFLNPYRAGLIASGAKWPGYFCAEADWSWFGSMTNRGAAYPEWLS